MTANGKPTDHREWVLAALDQYEVRLLRYAARLLGDDQQAQDAVQHTFLRLCDQVPEQLDELAAWLFVVCRNKALDMRRSNGRSRNSLEDMADDPVGRGPDPAELAETEDILDGLRRLVAALPNGQREAIDLWLEGFGYGEIGEITGRTAGATRVVVHRAITKLRDHTWTRKLLDTSRGSNTQETDKCENRHEQEPAKS